MQTKSDVRTLLQRYSAWRRKTFPASKQDLDWRYEALMEKLSSVAGSDGRNGLASGEMFPLFFPNSDGHLKALSALTVEGINNIFPALVTLCNALGARRPVLKPIQAAAETAADRDNARKLKELFDAQGSDKASLHNYHFLYGLILRDGTQVGSILEIGMGTNNVEISSNMGAAGRPGASLRAFRDYAPNAQVYGADIDRDILFAEERIDTFFVDQTKATTFEALAAAVPSQLDLVIDDGLHAPYPNVVTLAFALLRLKSGGWAVVEDIDPAANPFWELVTALLPARYEATLFLDGRTNVFAVQRRD